MVIVSQYQNPYSSEKEVGVKQLGLGIRYTSTKLTLRLKSNFGERRKSL